MQRGLSSAALQPDGKSVVLVAVCGPRDIADPPPALTEMMPDED